MGILKTAGADPTHDNDEGRVDVYEAAVSTGTGGAGTATVSWDRDFDTGSPKVFATGDASGASVNVTARGSSQCTVDVTGGPASSTVNVDVIAIGKSP